MRYDGKILSQLIRERRMTLNYSQDYIAGKLGLSQNAYSKLEQGQTGITLGKFLVLCEALESTPYEILELYTKHMTDK